MDLEYGAEYEAFRREVREFLKGWPLSGDEAALSQTEQEQRFRQRGIERGYVYRHIPTAYGGSGQPPDVLEETILRQEYWEAGAPGDIIAQGSGMLAPTLLEYGTEDQRRRFIPPTLSGDLIWCQGYSEPGAGSDLASLQSRAEIDGDEWIINGHKIWTTMAHLSDYMFGLFRTEPEAKKHGGISYLLVDMKSPGIEVRPLVEMTGAQLFNEVFFSDVRIPAENIVGERGQGWQVSRATLKHERNMIGNPALLRTYFDGVLDLARKTERRGRPAIEDPSVRQRLAELEGYFLCVEYGNARQITASARGEETKITMPTLMNKLYSTDTLQMLTRMGYDLIESEGLLAPQPSDSEYHAMGTPGVWTSMYMTAIAIAISGGASNIQRNIIGERALGLPRDLRSTQ